jgi:hypothetical protein
VHLVAETSPTVKKQPDRLNGTAMPFWYVFFGRAQLLKEVNHLLFNYLANFLNNLINYLINGFKTVLIP